MRKSFVRKPFKGMVAYEWQIGPLVLMWGHKDYKGVKPHFKYEGKNPFDGSRSLRVFKFFVFTDPYWR